MTTPNESAAAVLESEVLPYMTRPWTREALTLAIAALRAPVAAVDEAVAVGMLPTPTGWVRNTDGEWEFRLGERCPANRSGGFSTPWAAVYDSPTVRQYTAALAAATPAQKSPRLNYLGKGRMIADAMLREHAAAPPAQEATRRSTQNSRSAD